MKWGDLNRPIRKGPPTADGAETHLIRWPSDDSPQAWWVEFRPGRGYAPIAGPWPWKEAPLGPPLTQRPTKENRP